MHAIQTETGKEYQKFAEFATAIPPRAIPTMFINLWVKLMKLYQQLP